MKKSYELDDEWVSWSEFREWVGGLSLVLVVGYAAVVLAFGAVVFSVVFG